MASESNERRIPSEKNEMLLKLFFSRHQNNDKTINHLEEQYRYKLLERYNTYEAIENMITSCFGRTKTIRNIRLLPWTMENPTTLAAIEWCDARVQKF